jgi:2-C-methyl-D-erythritol 4-phosphate cytidylyltransferase
VAPDQHSQPVVAVLLAGGTGTRMGSDQPKQLLEIGGVTILERALRALHDHPAVDEVLVVMAPGHLETARQLADSGRYPKVSAVVEGGPSRTDSTRRAIARLGEREGVVLVHDAARPLLSAQIVSACVEALGRHEAVAVAIPSTDTLLEVDEDGFVHGVPPRTSMQRAQTPQGFRLSLLRDAFVRAAEVPGYEATDDCSLVLRFRPDVRVAVVPGDEANLKVTRPGDVEIAEQLLRRRDGRADGAGGAATPS